MIHLNKYDSMETMLMAMLKIMVCLRSAHYIKGLLLHLLIMTHQKKHMLPPYRMFAMRSSSFSEEAGEMSLSVLSRVSRGDSNVHDLKHCDHMFKLSTTFLRIGKQLEHGDDASSVVNNRVTVDPQSSEVAALVTFLNKTIKKIQIGSFKPYRKLPKANSMYCKRDAETPQAAPLQMRRLFESNDQAVFLYATTKAKELMNEYVDEENAQAKLDGDDPLVPVQSFSDDDSDDSSGDDDGQVLRPLASDDDDDIKDDDSVNALSQSQNNPTKVWMRAVLPQSKIKKVSLHRTSGHHDHDSGDEDVDKDDSSSEASQSSSSSIATAASSMPSTSSSKGAGAQAQPRKRKRGVSEKVDGAPSTVTLQPSLHHRMIVAIADYRMNDYVITRGIGDTSARFWLGKISQVITADTSSSVTAFKITWLIASTEHGPYEIEKTDTGRPLTDTVPVVKVIAGFRQLTGDNKLPPHVIKFVNEELDGIELVQQRAQRDQGKSKKVGKK